MLGIHFHPADGRCSDVDKAKNALTEPIGLLPPAWTAHLDRESRCDILVISGEEGEGDAWARRAQGVLHY